MKRCALLLVLMLAATATVPAAGLIIVENSSWWPGPLPPRPMPEPWPHPYPHPPRIHPFAPLEVENVRVRTRITDQVAITTIDEEFFNPNSARLEGSFMFPVPKGAHLDKFTMEID